jgi:hypothetical protein
MLNALWKAILMVVVILQMLMILIMLHTYEESDRQIERLPPKGCPCWQICRALRLARLTIVRGDLRLG